MKYLKQNKAIGSLFALSSVLLAVACFTITNSFAYPNEDTTMAKIWKVELTDVSINKQDTSYNVTNERIDFNVTLNNSNDEYLINASITNQGSFDAILKNIDLTSLNNIKIGTSEETGETYYLSDYVDTYITYTQDNKTNAIKKGDNVTAGNILKKHTKNNLAISLKYRDISSLSEDALVVLKQNVQELDGKRPLKFSMSACFNYVENIK